MSLQELYKDRRLYASTYKLFKDKYENREDKENLYVVGVTEAEFTKIIMNEFLGENWYVADPLSNTQVLECALYDILSTHSPKFKDKGELHHDIYRAKRKFREDR